MVLSSKFEVWKNLLHKIHLDSGGKFCYHAFTPASLAMLRRDDAKFLCWRFFTSGGGENCLQFLNLPLLIYKTN